MNISFRDPSGMTFTHAGRLLRIVYASGKSDLDAFLASQTFKDFTASGRLVRTDQLDREALADLHRSRELEELFEGREEVAAVVEHERLPFPSYPYEWPPEMLHEAAVLTLDLAESLHREGLGLKDSTPYNVLFRGPRPVFVDLLSFERREPSDPTWLPYAQFVSVFLLPLLVNQHFELRLDQLLLTNRDGLKPEDVYRLCGPLQKLRPPFLTLVSIPVRLASAHNPDDASIYERKSTGRVEKTKFILGHLFRRLRRLLDQVRPRAQKESAWSRYLSDSQHLSESYRREKQSFVEEALGEFRPQRVLDVGCNTGFFSRLAARRGARVVAIDQDPVAVGKVWRAAVDENLDILPLVVDITRPHPAVGWRNRECPSFLERARGSFDAVLMLAVIHHALVSERIPLEEILGLAAELTTDLLLVEYVDPKDTMFRRLARGRGHLFDYLTTAYFEQTCEKYFDIIRRHQPDDATRRLYLLRRKAVEGSTVHT